MAQYQPTPQTGAEPPLEWPWYGIGFVAAVKRFFTKYATFTGRASRGEYWWSYLFYVIVSVVLYAIAIVPIITAATAAQSSGTPPQLGAVTYVLTSLFGLFSLATVVPVLAVTVRRLHDTGKSGWFVLLGLIPFVGGIILLVLLVSGTTPDADRYGPPSSQGGAGAYGQQAYPPAQGYTA